MAIATTAQAIWGKQNEIVNTTVVKCYRPFDLTFHYYPFKIFLRFWLAPLSKPLANSSQLGNVHQIWKKFPISDKMTLIVQAIPRKGDGNQRGRGLHKLSCFEELGKMATRQQHTASATTSKYQTSIIVIFLDFHSTKQGLPLVDSWSRGLD